MSEHIDLTPEVNAAAYTKIESILSGTQPKGSISPPLSANARFTKLSDYLRGCGTPDRTQLLDDVASHADDLPLESLRRLNSKISAAIGKKEQAHSRGRQWLGLFYRGERVPKCVPLGERDGCPGTTHVPRSPCREALSANYPA